MAKTPQVKPDWNTGIYIGDGVVATPKPAWQWTDQEFEEWLENDWFTSGETSWEEYYDDE